MIEPMNQVSFPIAAEGRRNPEDDVAERFRAFAATGPNTAQDLVPADAEEAQAFDRLRRHGVIRGAASGFYFDEDAFEELQARRRGWVFGGLGLAAIVAGVAGWRLVSARG